MRPGDVHAGGTDDPDAERAAGLRAIEWLGWATRFVLFTGKGGVGKTTIASATAVALADAGHRVLLVSTDPASNLSDVFQMTTGEQATPVPAVPGLDVMDLDPHAAADGYRARVTGPYRGVLPAAELTALEEKLAGACTVEVAAFDAFARLLADPTSMGMYDHVVFDTAPTGHTLRLLSLPAAWSDYLGAHPDATSCLGPLAGLQDDRPVYARAVDVLQDASATTVVLVTRADRGALAVAASAADELRDLGIGHFAVVVNGILTSPTAVDGVARSYATAQQSALADAPVALALLPTSIVPLVAFDVTGVDALRLLVTGQTAAPPAQPEALSAGDVGGSLAELVDEIATAGRGAVLVTGKGGVGKTTIAHLIAVELARRGHQVHLSTTDPAGRAPAPIADLPTLTTSAIDAEAATREYVAGRMRSAARQSLDQAHLDLLAEDLRSPCSQEVAVFEAFHRLLGRARDGFVVIDTAPTGHTLLLLDTTGAYHRQSMMSASPATGRIITPLMRLQDPNYSKVLIVALAETTPVSEATELQTDLRRAGIEPFGWVVNATLSGSGTVDPVLAARSGLEQRLLHRVRHIAPRLWTMSWDPMLDRSPGAEVGRQRVARTPSA